MFSVSTDELILGDMIEVRKNERIMDLCSGNGVIPLLLAAKCNQKIEAIEIQDQLVEMARRSFVHNSLDERLTMYLMDLNNVYDPFKPSQYTLVTCNPPYFKVNQLNQHQKEAHKIARHEVMCDFTDCVKAARHLLKEGGRFIVVHRADRLMDVFTEMRNAKIEHMNLTFV